MDQITIMERKRNVTQARGRVASQMAGVSVYLYWDGWLRIHQTSLAQSHVTPSPPFSCSDAVTPPSAH